MQTQPKFRKVRNGGKCPPNVLLPDKQGGLVKSAALHGMLYTRTVKDREAAELAAGACNRHFAAAKHRGAWGLKAVSQEAGDYLRDRALPDVLTLRQFTNLLGTQLALTALPRLHLYAADDAPDAPATQLKRFRTYYGLIPAVMEGPMFCQHTLTALLVGTWTPLPDTLTREQFIAETAVLAGLVRDRGVCEVAGYIRHLMRDAGGKWAFIGPREIPHVDPAGRIGVSVPWPHEAELVYEGQTPPAGAPELLSGLLPDNVEGEVGPVPPAAVQQITTNQAAESIIRQIENRNWN